MSTAVSIDTSSENFVQQFDAIVQDLYSGNEAKITTANEYLSSFVNDDNSLSIVDKILSDTKSAASKMMALKVLNTSIEKKWNTIDSTNQEAIKGFIFKYILEYCTSWESVRNKENKMVLMKYNMCLISIAKREYPHRWPTFVQDICSSATLDNPVIQNNLVLLKVVGEEVFEFGNKSLTSRWVERKKQALSNDFQHIMHLAGTVLLQSRDTQLLKCALELLTEYIPWMNPSSFMYEEILLKISECIVGPQEVREAGLQCFKEICAVPATKGANGDIRAKVVVEAFEFIFKQICNSLPTVHSAIADRIVYMHENGGPVDQQFIVNLSLLITSFLQNYLSKIAYNDVLLVSAHEALVGISNIMSDRELFKSCVEYWLWLGDFLLNSGASNLKQTLSRKLQRVLKGVRYVVIRRMVKPEEVIVVVEDGEVRREHMQDVEELQMYELMKKTIVTYTLLDSKETLVMMENMLARQLDGSEWSWESINALSWSAGSIADTLPEDEERDFFTTFLKGLLELLKKLHGRDNRTVVATNVLFFVGQYTRFLKTRSKFFRVVNKKVFEFMQYNFEGVQEMAVDTLYKLSHDVAALYVEPNNSNDTDSNSSGAYNLAEEIADSWTASLALLNPPLTQSCYACVGCMVAVETRERQPLLLAKFLNAANVQFKQFTEVAANGGETGFCHSGEQMNQLLYILKLFSSMASTSGDAFLHEMQNIGNDLFGFYSLMCKVQAQLLDTSNANNNTNLQSRHETARNVRLIKKEILRLFENFITNSEQKDFIAEYCIPTLFDVVLVDFASSVTEFKEPVALALAAACVNTLGDRLSPRCASILDFTFAPTVTLISNDFESFPEFRVNLFKVIEALDAHCFVSFVDYVTKHEDIIEGMLWAIKHTDFPTMSTALRTLNEFLENVGNSYLAMDFYTHYIQKIFQEVLMVTLDSLHSAGFPLHCEILKQLFHVSSNVDPETPVVGRTAVSNFLYEQLCVIPSVASETLVKFINDCYDKFAFESELNTVVADFLIEVQVWGAEEENKMIEIEKNGNNNININNNNNSNFNVAGMNAAVNPNNSSYNNGQVSNNPFPQAQR